MLQGRYTLAVLWEYAGTLGLFDLGYTEPEGVRTADLPDYLDYYFEGALSRYDGLLAVRLNPLGAYATGRSDSFRPSPLRGLDERIRVQVALDPVRLVGEGDVQRRSVRIRIDRYRSSPELAERPEDPDRDLAPICNEHLLEHMRIVH